MAGMSRRQGVGFAFAIYVQGLAGGEAKCFYGH